MSVRQSSPTTKKSRIAAELEREIASGTWPVSSCLPSEARLVERFSVSRQTVRAAIARLQTLGLVRGRQGVGSQVVRRSSPEEEYSQSLESIQELAFYARNTSVEVVRTENLPLTAKQADAVGGQVGETWCHAVTLRTALGQVLPMGLSSVWVPEASRRAVDASCKSGLPVFLEIQKANGRMVSRVRQVLGASLSDRVQARLLRCEAHEPLLRIQRWYYAADDTLLEMSDTLHPNARFQYAMTLRHEAAGARPRATSSAHPACTAS
jgi:GntR family transcriptional regulator